MKAISILAIGFSCCMACSGSKNESAENNDTTTLETDTVLQENTSTVSIVTTTNDSALYVAGELQEEKGEFVYVSSNQYSFISDPYDFSLSAASIEELLGGEAETKVEEFEGGEDYSAYTYSTITFNDTKISFYDYPGKHFSTITTPLLPLKNGIKIGMKKDDFLQALGFLDSNAPKATVYRLEDDYGSIDFSFRADTLYLIYAYYEEGD